MRLRFGSPLLCSDDALGELGTARSVRATSAADDDHYRRPARGNHPPSRPYLRLVEHRGRRPHRRLGLQPLARRLTLSLTYHHRIEPRRKRGSCNVRPAGASCCQAASRLAQALPASARIYDRDRTSRGRRRYVLIPRHVKATLDRGDAHRAVVGIGTRPGSRHHRIRHYHRVPEYRDELRRRSTLQKPTAVTSRRRAPYGPAAKYSRAYRSIHSTTTRIATSLFSHPTTCIRFPSRSL